MAYIGQSLTEGTRRVYTYVATASQTTFNAVYGVGAVDVYQNGILLAPADYTASDGATVVLGVGAAFQDEITIVCHNTFSVADTVSASQGGTFNGPLSVTGAFTSQGIDDNATSTAMTIDANGNLLVGKTATSTTTVGAELIKGGAVYATRDGNVAAVFNRLTSDGDILHLRKDGTTVGSISVSSSGTTYNTTSDRRLKTDIQPIANATDKLMAMNPVSHKWIADPEADAVVGFIAQEMQEIVPEAVSGTPDGEEMMSMDYGRITPVLVAALQDAHKKIAELESRLNTLEGK